MGLRSIRRLIFICDFAEMGQTMEKKRLHHAEISALCEELALLLHAGVGAGDGLALLAEENAEESRELLASMAEQVDSGMPLAAAFRSAGQFPSYVTGLIEVGERSGRTEEALLSLSRYYERRERLNRQVRSALLYPAILLLMMLVVIVVLLVRVLPVFNEVYASLGGQLTGVAGGLLRLGRILDQGMPVLCVLLAGAAVCLTLFSVHDGFRDWILGIWRRHMGDRGISRQIRTAQVAQALAMGMQSGLPLEESLALAGELQKDLPAVQRRCEDCRAGLEQGMDLARALKNSGVLPPSACRLLALGLRGGTGDVVMEEVAARLADEGEAALETAVSRVEPALVLVSSILVGLILLSVMLPLMHIMTAIG